MVTWHLTMKLFPAKCHKVVKTMTSNRKQFTVTRKMLTAVACDQSSWRWPDVVARISVCFSKFAFVLSRELFCYIANHFGPLGTVYFVSLVSQCFPRWKIEILVNQNSLLTSPRDQSLSVKCRPFTLKCNTWNWSKSHSSAGLICLTILF